MIAWIVAGALAVAFLVQFVFLNMVQRKPPASAGTVDPSQSRMGLGAVLVVLLFGVLAYIGYQQFSEHTDTVWTTLGRVPLYGWAIGGATVVAVLVILTSPSHLVWSRVINAIMAFALLVVAFTAVQWLDIHLPTGRNAATTVAPAVPVVAADTNPLPPPIEGVAQPATWTAWYQFPVEEYRTVLSGTVKYQCGYGANEPARPEDIKDSPCEHANWIRFMPTSDRPENFTLSFRHMRDAPLP